MEKKKATMTHNSFMLLDLSKAETDLIDKISEVKHIHAMPPKEIESIIQKAVDGIMPCEACIHYPPSACDGKPCCVCDPDDIYLNCFEDMRERR